MRINEANPDALSDQDCSNTNLNSVLRTILKFEFHEKPEAMSKLIALGIVVMSLSSYGQNTFLEREGQNECDCGKLEATKNAEEGKYILYKSGLNDPAADQDFDRFHIAYMKRNFGIHILPDKHRITKKDYCYFAEMNRVIKERFGADIYDRGKERARYAYNLVCNR